MKKVLLALVTLLVLAIAGGAAFLALWQVPPPTAMIEVDIPNERFGR